MNQVKYLYTKLVFTFFIVLSVVHASAETTARDKYQKAKNLIHEYSGKGDNHKIAMKLAEEIFNSDQNNPYFYLIIAELRSQQYINYKRGTAKDILELTSKVISLNKDIAAAYVINAKIASVRNNLTKVRDNLDIAISLEPNNPEANYELAMLRQSENNFRESERLLIKTIDLHTSPDRKSNIYHWLAKLYEKMTPPDIKKAQQAMAKGVELSPTAPWKLVNYSIFLNTKTNRYDEAIKFAKLSLEQKNFKMGKKALGMAMYSKWAETFMQNALSPISRENELKKLKKIEEQTGISVEHAKDYVFKYMPASSIIHALGAMGLL